MKTKFLRFWRRFSRPAVCGCGLPRGGCVRGLQDDFVLRNGLPCRFPRSAWEWEEMQARVARRRLHLALGVMLIGSLWIGVLVALGCWAVFLWALFGGAL